MLTMHMRVRDNNPPERIVAEVKRRLAERFHIAHATIEVEFDGCAEDADRAPSAAPANGR